MYVDSMFDEMYSDNAEIRHSSDNHAHVIDNTKVEYY